MSENICVSCSKYNINCPYGKDQTSISCYDYIKAIPKSGKKILLVDIDSTIPNLALKKIEMYHAAKGDEIIWNLPLAIDLVDKAYVSCIFPENRYKCEIFEGRAYIGGTGWDFIKKRTGEVEQKYNTVLPEEIESLNPKINYGFTTRGCIRNCYFCFVPRKEGKIRVIGDIYNIWDGKSKEIILMDNNILALPDHFMKIAKQLKREKLTVDFNQGLDHRLLTEEIWSELISLKHVHEIRFAFDDIGYIPVVNKAFKIMEKVGLRDWQTRWYVYVGVKDTFDTVYERLEILRSHKQHAYVMRDRQVVDKPEWIALAAWAGEPGNFKKNFIDLMDNSEVYGRHKPLIKPLIEEYNKKHMVNV